jgi:hypothetical protein
MMWALVYLRRGKRGKRGKIYKSGGKLVTNGLANCSGTEAIINGCGVMDEVGKREV